MKGWLKISKKDLFLRNAQNSIFWGNKSGPEGVKVFRRICVFIACFAILEACLSEEMPQWTEQTEYLYGMFITGIDGEPLPPSPLDSSVIRNGIRMEIINGMPYPDRFVLLAVLNGHIQPFYIDDVRYDYCISDIGANAHAIINATFQELYLADTGVHYLHILCVGLLDKLPADEHDPVADYSISITLPFATDEEANTSIDFMQPDVPLPKKIVDENTDHYCRLNFLDRIEEDGIYYPDFVQEISDGEAEFTLIAAGDFQLMQAIIFYDDKPCIGNDGALPCFWVTEDNGCKWEYTLHADTDGPHQTFAIALPLFDKSGLISATPKIRFDHIERESDE